jgi:hypothetical protein
MTEGAKKAGQGIGGGSYNAAVGLAWSVWALCVVLLALTALLDYYNPPIMDRGNGNVYAFFAVPLLVHATVGAIVASRRPGNLVGWLLCLIGVLLAILGFSVAYSDYVLLTNPGTPLPGGVYTACLSQTLVLVPVLILTISLLVLFFPNGRLPNRSLRAVPWVAFGGSMASAMWALITEEGFERYFIANPFWLGGTLGAAVEGFGRLGTATLLVCLVVVVITIFVRLGSSGGEERQQVKWFAYAAAVQLTFCYVALPFSWFLPGWVSFPLGIAGFSALPVAVGFAVLRYKLYDIDRIINRTLVYGLLTAISAGIYFGGVTATQALLRNLTGHQRLPQLVVVVSTLVIAALFNPLRRFIQSFIDRRFYRRKYDARKTLEEFSATLRDETDLEALNEDLVGVVRETMQPAHISLWLRPETAPKGEQAK